MLEKYEALFAKWIWKLPLEANSSFTKLSKSSMISEKISPKEGRLFKATHWGPWEGISGGFKFHEIVDLNLGACEKISFRKDCLYGERDLFIKMSRLL